MGQEYSDDADVATQRHWPGALIRMFAAILNAMV